MAAMGAWVRVQVGDWVVFYRHAREERKGEVELGSAKQREAQPG
jgi:hypothetical protein